ncbi:hypothetical protein [Cellulomonas wangsupingiae]|uniref:Uncharacterized protein n=1 Tax=Cellulomonas wangsupingiae TaxID=2968085 RepID=A0ABY5K5I7_9CELL|nr:hypothetical protein [Cellulomonas wangsupingiae]MCC2336305.1 hypothetical protein [Cellulomonas wangsupingiae]MCM0640693.1 hypothetical protein [Cellulomonas wangsupingiae]UUI65716.1 hypothetical protein NP075_02980 [Cellulomonas wangsupingiae]
MRVRPYHSARSTAAHIFHEDDDCPVGRNLAWFDKIEGREDCEPCPQCVRTAATRADHPVDALPVS